MRAFHSPSSTTHRSLTFGWNLLLTLVLLAASGLSHAQTTVTSIPHAFTGGARVKVIVTGLALSTSYRLRLEEARPGIREFDLSDFSSGSNTSSAQLVSIPDAPAGNYEIVLYRVQLGVTRIASTAVSVGESPVITLSPAQAPPGRRIRIDVSNLATGSLRVTYAGQTILGPVPVGTAYTGYFLVPGDRPGSLPATVPVVAENLVGRLIARRATVDFQAQAPNGAPRLGFESPQVPASQLTPRTSFTVGGRLLDGAGLPPAGRQQLYFIGDGVTVPVDTSVQVGSDGTLQMQARAPDAFLDGLSSNADRPGALVMVNQGRDRDTQANRDGRFIATGNTPVVVIDGQDGNSTTFEIEVRGVQPGGVRPLLSGAIVEADAGYQTAFYATFPSDIPSADDPEESSDYQAFMSLQTNQLRGLNVLNLASPSTSTYGCPVTFFRKITSAQGRAIFTIRPEDLVSVNAGEILGQFCSNHPELCRPASGTSPKGNNFTGRVFFLMNIYAVHLGYRNFTIAVEYDGDTGQFFNQTDGTPFVNNRTTVLLDPSADSDFDLRTLRIDGVGPPERVFPPGDCPMGSGGVCYHSPARYQSMYTYPDTSRWPSNRISQRNIGRVARLMVDTQIYGPVSFGRIRIGDTAWANFNASGTTPGCVLEASTEVGAGEVEYVASLPDLTRLPAGIIDGTVELRFSSQPLRTFPIKLYTKVPQVDVTNPNVATLQINALTDQITGTYNTPGLTIPVSSPGHGVGRLDSMTVNAGSFSLRRDADGAEVNALNNTTNNDVAANPGGPKPATGIFFGFSDDYFHNTPATTTLFETGIIPLFRYSFGIPPIAAATMGADFWMAATLKYYGQALPQGMNATIDPRLAGGVDLFFDLDVLFGIVSGSIRAESEMGIAMRSRINQGGLAHLPNNPSPPAGECFTFDLDGVWEACAVGICAGGRENLIAVREPDNCANSRADTVPLMLRRAAGMNANDDPQSVTNFDLPRPRYTATALGGDGRGHAISLGVNDNGDIIATHITGGVVGSTTTIAQRTVAVQHVDVTFYDTNKAMAVWSENTRSLSQIQTLMQTQRERAFDDIARTQRLRYSNWDGTRWSDPADLTSLGNDGKPQLGGCVGSPRFLPSNCPTGGEITAVWERDANANLDAPDIEVWSGRWRPDGRGWTNLARVSETGTSSDMHPSVAYRNNTAVVAWARNPGGAFVDLNQRHIAYRFLDGSAQVNATALGNAVGWIDIGVSAADAVVIAYTRAQDPLGFVGNRQALFAARASNCSSGTCNFLVTEVLDPNQRQIRVERPRVAFDESDTPMIGFRALAFGPDSQGRHALPGDLPGIVLGTGELGMVHVHSFSQPRYTAQLTGLSDNGLQHWKPDFIFDDTMGGVLAVSMQAQAPVGLRTPLEIAQLMSPEGSPVATKASELSGGGTLRMAMGGPDFEVRNARLSRTAVRSGDFVGLNLDLVNIGSPFVPAEHGTLRVVASLNGPAGVGTELANFSLNTSLTSNATRAVTFVLTIPTGVPNDERQTIFVDIVAGDDANSVDGSRDHEQIEVNAMPTPIGLNASTRTDSPFVNIVWTDPGDSRIAGWRIWKLDDIGNWQHLGSTGVPGYIDLTGRIGTQVTYRVASYSANGMESEPSESISAFIRQSSGDRVFADGFEANLR